MTSQPLTHSRARTALFWATLVISLAEAVLFVLLVRFFARPDQPGLPLPLTLLPIAALVALILDILCLVLGRRANRILGVLALLAVLAQVGFVAWVPGGLAQL